jgi:hypothetical protein
MTPRDRLICEMMVMAWRKTAAEALERDEIRLNRHRALGSCLRMIFSENRCTLFRIMRQRRDSFAALVWTHDKRALPTTVTLL